MSIERSDLLHWALVGMVADRDELDKNIAEVRDEMARNGPLEQPKVDGRGKGMSPDGRKRTSEATKRYWAAYRTAKKKMEAK